MKQPALTRHSFTIAAALAVAAVTYLILTVLTPAASNTRVILGQPASGTYTSEQAATLAAQPNTVVSADNSGVITPATSEATALLSTYNSTITPLPNQTPAPELLAALAAAGLTVAFLIVRRRTRLPIALAATAAGIVVCAAGTHASVHTTLSYAAAVTVALLAGARLTTTSRRTTTTIAIIATAAVAAVATYLLSNTVLSAACATTALTVAITSRRTRPATDHSTATAAASYTRTTSLLLSAALTLSAFGALAWTFTATAATAAITSTATSPATDAVTAAGFPAGLADPIIITTEAANVANIKQVAGGLPDVNTVRVTGTEAENGVTVVTVAVVTNSGPSTAAAVNVATILHDEIATWPGTTITGTSAGTAAAGTAATETILAAATMAALALAGSLVYAARTRTPVHRVAIRQTIATCVGAVTAAIAATYVTGVGWALAGNGAALGTIGLAGIAGAGAAHTSTRNQKTVGIAGAGATIAAGWLYPTYGSTLALTLGAITIGWVCASVTAAASTRINYHLPANWATGAYRRVDAWLHGVPQPPAATTPTKPAPQGARPNKARVRRPGAAGKRPAN